MERNNPKNETPPPGKAGNPLVTPTDSAPMKEGDFPWNFIGWMGVLLLIATALVISFAWGLKLIGLHTASLYFIYFCQVIVAIGAMGIVPFLWKSVWTREIKESKVAITMLLLMPLWIGMLHLSRCYTGLEASIASTSVKSGREAKDK